jgi:hypothetical protein
MPATRRRLLKAMPVWLRTRLLLGMARRLVRESYEGSRAIARLRKGTARFDVRASIFCSVRTPVAHPLCGFYAAAITRMMALFDIRAKTEVVACRATGEPTCMMSVAVLNGKVAEEA